jgi:hypothetical protein
MGDKPILFSAPMIRALLDGRKSMTRRVLKPQPQGIDQRPLGFVGVPAKFAFTEVHPGGANFTSYIPVKYAPGDRVWVREAWQSNGLNWGKRPRDMCPAMGPVHYAATDAGEWKPYWGGWKPSIHMPRWASRLTLTVTDVRVQRLQDISESDAMAEGANPSDLRMYPELGTSRDWLRDLWNSLHGPDAWAANPWVVALTFEVHRCNIDQMPGASHG